MSFTRSVPRMLRRRCAERESLYPLLSLLSCLYSVFPFIFHSSIPIPLSSLSASGDDSSNSSVSQSSLDYYDPQKDNLRRDSVQKVMFDGSQRQSCSFKVPRYPSLFICCILFFDNPVHVRLLWTVQLILRKKDGLLYPWIQRR